MPDDAGGRVAVGKGKADGPVDDAGDEFVDEGLNERGGGGWKKKESKTSITIFFPPFFLSP